MELGSQRSSRNKKGKKKNQSTRILKKAVDKLKRSTRKKTTNTKKAQSSSRQKKKKCGTSSRQRKTKSSSLSATVTSGSAMSSKDDIKDPKNIEILNREIDEEEVNKLVKRYKAKKELAVTPVSVKDELTLDRLIKKPMRIPTQNPKNEQSERSTKSKTASLDSKGNGPDESKEKKRKTIKKQGELNAQQSQQQVVPVDNYDEYPKIEEVLKTTPENVFNASGTQPYWMDNVQPTEDDLKDVEPVCSIGSEQIEEFHERKFKLVNAPETKLVLDQWEVSSVLMDRDDLFFTNFLVFSNTLRSLFNVAVTKETMKPKAEEGPVEEVLGQTQADDSIPLTFLDPPNQGYTYSRSDPLGSGNKRTTVSKADLNCQPIRKTLY